MLKPLTEETLPIIFKWRNHPEIRKYMYTTHEISWEEHRQWFHKMHKSASDQCLVYFNELNKPAGVVNFNKINYKNKNAYWGFYAAPDAPKGTGISLGNAALKYAFTNLELHKLCAEALSFNKPSIQFHLRLNFEKEGIQREQYFDGKNHHDIVLFGLLKCEWQRATNHESK